MRGMIHKVDGAAPCTVARRGQGVREAVVLGDGGGCGRHRRRGSPDAIILEGVIGYLRGLWRAARDGGAKRDVLRRPRLAGASSSPSRRSPAWRCA